MVAKALRMSQRPVMEKGRLVLAFSGWMDGGEVSTGTVNRLVDQLGAQEIARIEPDDFYILNFPGSMEVTALFRPMVRIRRGRVRAVAMPENIFYAAEHERLVLFTGKEPNLKWGAFADCILELCREVGVERIYFVGSFGGAVPHTRQPRMYASFSHEELEGELEACGFAPSEYRGPASFSSYLLSRAAEAGVRMANLVAEIPGYLEGPNPPCIEAMMRRLARLLGVRVNLDALRTASDEWEAQVSQVVEKNAKLAQTVRKLEQQYDDELLQSPLGQAWMEGQQEEDEEKGG